MDFLFKSLLLLSFFGLQQKCAVPNTSEAPSERKLVWQDEFNGSGLPDSTKWGYDLGSGCPNLCGWGNNELQYYTAHRSENARVENGLLLIEARREKWLENKNYTSARLVSKNKGDWKYGGWPHSGEVDIMEHVGFKSDTVYATALSLIHI